VILPSISSVYGLARIPSPLSYATLKTRAVSFHADLVKQRYVLMSQIFTSNAMSIQTISPGVLERRPSHEVSPKHATPTLHRTQQFPRFLHVPKDIPFVIYDDLLDRCIELIAFPDPGVAYEVLTLDPAIVQASRQFREKA
jgi:hypothetical protein